MERGLTEEQADTTLEYYSMSNNTEWSVQTAKTEFTDEQMEQAKKTNY